MTSDDTKIIEGLWNSSVSPLDYGTKDLYYEHVFQQYVMFVEMADRVSHRRNLANTFFLTLNTLLITAATFFYEKGPTIDNTWLNLFPLASALALCWVWWRLIKSYRQLNSAKYRVIGEYEKALPSSPYWEAEWKRGLREGKDSSLYKPLSDIENWVPIIFALLYIIGVLAIILS